MVDDSPDDRLFMRMALSKSSKLVIAWEAGGGDEALAYLSGEGEFHDRSKYPFPDILLLDLKMPRITGYDVLEWLQSKSYQNLVIVVVSGSHLPDDISRSLSLGAKAYYQKTIVRSELERMISEIESFSEIQGSE